MTIKHLVISGGGPTLLQTIGTIQHLVDEKYIKYEDIQTIYGTSAGAIVGLLFCLNYDWNNIVDYIINRPWHDLFKVKVQDLLEVYTKKGLVDQTIIEKCFKPLFCAKNISMEITLEDFYELSKIEFHMFSFEINSFNVEDISYKTHPKLKLLTAIQMTCSIPIMVCPIFGNDTNNATKGKCYVDGGVICNYPLQYCCDKTEDKTEILGFKNKYSDQNTNEVSEDSTILEFLMVFLFKLIYSLSTDNKQPSIPNEVITDVTYLSMDSLKKAFTCSEERKKLYESGIEIGQKYLSDALSKQELNDMNKTDDLSNGIVNIE